MKNNKIRDDFTAQGLPQARELLIYDNLFDEEKRQYEYDVKTNRIRNSEIKTAFTDGEFKGRIEGEAKDRAEGEIKKAEQVAMNAFKKGMSIPDISDITSLTVEQVTEILKRKNLV